METEWLETKAAWARLKNSLRGLWREIHLSRAQGHAIKAMRIYLKHDPMTALRIANALRKSLDETS